MNFKSVVSSAVALVLLAAPGLAQEKPAAAAAAAREKPAAAAAQEKPGAPAIDQEAMMKKWAEYATPGESHKLLEKMVGNWTFTNRAWMDPAAPPMESIGKASFHMILGGRYLQQNYTGEIMGQPFEGLGLIGYDNFNKYFVSSWSDNAGTGIMTMNGNLADNGDIVFAGTMDDPMTGQKNKKFREVMHWNSPDSFVYEMYEGRGEGGEIKMMEITHTRVK